MKLEPEKKKRQYEPVSVEILRFAAESVLTESGTNNGYDPGIDLPLDPFDPPKP